jgi:hypothetical protein
MPFTFAHPAYAVPLKFVNPRNFSVTGLALGSMAPDFEYFLMLEPHQTVGHTLMGFFVQAAPLSILFAYLFHGVAKEALALHLPSLFGLDRRAYALIKPWKLSKPRDWIVFLASVFAGFLSHLAVDAFTHESGFMVQRLPALQAVLFLDLPLFKLLQYGLSVFGLAFLACAVGLALRRAAVDRVNPPIATYRRKLFYWAAAASVAVLTTALKLLFASSGNTIGILVVAPISGLCAGVLLASLVWNIRKA